MGPVRQNPIQRTVSLFICVCITLCTIVAHNIAQNRPDSFPPNPPDNHHCSDDVYLREGGRYGPKIVGCAPLWEGEVGPHLTWCDQCWGLGLPACQVSSCSIQPFGDSTPTSQTDRTDRQRSDSKGRTILQTVAEKRSHDWHCPHPFGGVVCYHWLAPVIITFGAQVDYVMINLCTKHEVSTQLVVRSKDRIGHTKFTNQGRMGQLWVTKSLEIVSFNRPRMTYWPSYANQLSQGCRS